jgi:N-acetylmuramoyl-L-alanine amidase
MTGPNVMLVTQISRVGILAIVLGVMLHLPGYSLAQQARAHAERHPSRDAEPQSHAEHAYNETGSQSAKLTAVRPAANGDLTRVVMEVSRPVLYQVGHLPGDAASGLGPRIYVDIASTKLAMETEEPISVRNGTVKQIRIGQFTPDIVRVVLDLEAPRDFSAFLLPEPFRIVLELNDGANGAVATAATNKRRAGAETIDARRSKPKPTGIRKIVLDPGHGGKDPGAIGPGGIAEKDIVLTVARKLAAKLAKEMGIEVVLTRTDDRFIPLEDRTAIANAQNADLFISLHMNASPNADARGVETYYLDNTTDEASIRLAARENATSRKNISDLQFILSDMLQNMKLEDSVTLAHRLQGALVATSSGTHLREIKDLGVKKALFYVLVGARMPSVLVEMFFITNRDEVRAMSQEKFQEAVADSLFDGIQKYHHSVIAAKTL